MCEESQKVCVQSILNWANPPMQTSHLEKSHCYICPFSAHISGSKLHKSFACEVIWFFLPDKGPI
eukprot:c20816_g3_i1 orf=106-300(-)